jgi:hypothetical protein
MKKVENVLNDLPGRGKTSPSKKFTMNRGEGQITAMKSPVELDFSRRKRIKFDITRKQIRSRA